jgi:hypothetical protein
MRESRTYGSVRGACDETHALPLHRRDIITRLGSVAVWPVVVRAQQQPKIDNANIFPVFPRHQSLTFRFCKIGAELERNVRSVSKAITHRFAVGCDRVCDAFALKMVHCFPGTAHPHECNRIQL